MKVPLLDLGAQYTSIAEEVLQAIGEVCDSQQFILGPRVRQLEEEIADYCQCPHAVGVSSGTDALLVSLMALDVGLGDEVVTTPYSFFATAGAVARVGARAVFCDIDPQTFNLDARKVGDFLEYGCERTAAGLVNRQTGAVVKAVLPVHLFGQMTDMEAIMALANRHNLKVIEDAAQAIGTEQAGGGRAGSLGDIGCFSFFPSKNLGAFGDGGMCTTQSAELDERLRVLRVHGSKPKYFHALVGGNFRLDAIQAAVVSVKLRYLDEWTAARQANARYYDHAFERAGLSDHVHVPKAPPNARHIYNQYVIRARQRDELKSWLGGRGIGTEIYYPKPLHLQECFRSWRYGPGDFAEAEKASAETLALPIYPELNSVQQDYVVATICEFYRQAESPRVLESEGVAEGKYESGAGVESQG